MIFMLFRKSGNSANQMGLFGFFALQSDFFHRAQSRFERKHCPSGFRRLHWKIFLHHLHHFIVIHGARQTHHHVSRRIQRLLILYKIFALQSANHILGSHFIPTDRLIAKNGPFKIPGHLVHGRVLIHVEFLQNHSAFFFNFFLIKTRMEQHIRNHIQRELHVLARHFHKITRIFLGSKRIEVPSNSIDRLGHGLGIFVFFCPFEKHVLQKVRNPIDFPVFPA